MDSGDSTLIWDFLLRKPIDNHTLKSLISALPPPNPENPNLKKLFLLKKLESDPISETTLDLFAFLAQIEGVSSTMRDAFCAAAVECTVNFVNLEAGGVKKSYKLLDIVNSLWRGKIKKSVENGGGFGSDKLWAWQKLIEEAVWDDAVWDNVVEECRQLNGVQAITAYIKEEWQKMGPSFLEMLAERVRSDESLQRVLGLGEEAPPPKEMNEEKTKSKMKEVSSRGSRGTSGNSGGANIIDPNETAMVPSLKVADIPEAGESLQHSQAASSNVSNEPRPIRVCDGSQEGRCVNLRRRNNRSGSIAGSQEGRDMKSKKRRKNRSWSIHEEDVLRDAVEKHGQGNWNAILFHNRDNFVDRTPVDLKDKYRNMTKESKTRRF